jgi:GT2 family glycosyltransferase
MKLAIGVPTLNRYDLLARLVDSAETGTVVPDWYVVIDNGGKADVRNVCPTEEASLRMGIHRPGSNVGVAASWNRILRLGYEAAAEYIVISNDDITLGPDTLKKMVEAAEAKPEIGLIVTCGWSLFLQKKWVAEKIGYYDEAFWPAYFEDGDYAYRLKLGGVPWTEVADPAVHHEGSATIRAFNEHKMFEHGQTFEANARYYYDKWGGIPGEEKFTEPKKERKGPA